MRHRRLIFATALSLLLHAAALLVVAVVQPPPTPMRIAVRHLPSRPPPAARFRGSTSQMRAAGLTRQAARDLATPQIDATDLPSATVADSLETHLGDAPGGPPGVERVAPSDAMPAPGELAPMAQGEVPAAMRVIQDMAEKQSFAYVDPETGKLVRAQLFLVATGHCGGGASPAKQLDDLLRALQRGQAAPRSVPLDYQIESIPCGRALRANELRRHRVILTDFVAVESAEALAEHLADGGFALSSLDMVQRMEAHLRRQGTRRVEREVIEPGHPLFSAFYDIDEATFAGMQGVPRPFTALQVDGRLAAIGGLRFRLEKTSGYAGSMFVGAALKPHLSNLLYINALAYGLVQPSALGGRYVHNP